MDTFLLASGMIAAIFLFAASLVFMGTEDRELIAEISYMLGMARRFNFSKGWVAESKASRSRIWVSRWEDVTYEMADLMIFVALAQPLPFPFVLANVKRATTGFPFDTQFSRTKRIWKNRTFRKSAMHCSPTAVKMTEIVVSALFERLGIYCHDLAESPMNGGPYCR